MANRGYVRPIEKWRSVRPAIRKGVARFLRATAFTVTNREEHEAMKAAAALLEQARRNDDVYLDVYEQVMRLETPWPLQDVVVRLVQAAEHLLDYNGSDVHGHEEIRAAVAAAKGILRAFGIVEVAKIHDELGGAPRVRYADDEKPMPGEGTALDDLPHAEDFGSNPSEFCPHGRRRNGGSCLPCGFGTEESDG